MSETTITQSIVRRLRREFPGIYVRKIHRDEAQAMMLDLILIWRGRGMALEVKKPGEKYTVLQRSEAQEVANAGGGVACVHSADEAVKFIREMFPNE